MSRAPFAGQLRCDDCQIVVDVADIFSRMDDKCEQCGGAYLSAADRAIVSTLRDLADAGLIESGRSDDALLNVHIDTAALRK